MTEVLLNKWFQVVGVPLFMAFIGQALLLLGKRSQISAVDFASLPYSLGISSLAINAAFAISKPQSINLFATWTVVLIFAMSAMALVHKVDSSVKSPG